MIEEYTGFVQTGHDKGNPFVSTEFTGEAESTRESADGRVVAQAMGFMAIANFWD